MVNPQPTDAHIRIAHSLFEEIAMRDFSKRQRIMIDLVLRLSWGCGKMAWMYDSYKMITKTGQMYYLKGDEPKNIQTFIVSGGTMDILLAAIEEAFEQYQPRHPKDKISSVNYCLSFAWKKLERDKAIESGKTAQPMPERSQTRPWKRRNKVIPMVDKLTESVQWQMQQEKEGANLTQEAKSITDYPDMLERLQRLRTKA